MSTPSNLSEQILALPSGAGSVQSAGQTFQVRPYTGTGSYVIPIETKAGQAGIAPALSLTYSTHAGSGIAGVGWSLGLAKIERRTDKGLPSFDDQVDTFALQGDELLPVGAERMLAGSDRRSLNLFFRHSDHLESGHMLTKNNGDLLSQEEYFPYGRASDRRDARNRYRFIDVENDEDTGLCMAGPRTYDPVSGRFLQGDPIAEQVSRHESPYSYSSGNPVARVDASGYQDTGVTDQGLYYDEVEIEAPAPAAPSNTNLDAYYLPEEYGEIVPWHILERRQSQIDAGLDPWRARRLELAGYYRPSEYGTFVPTPLLEAREARHLAEEASARMWSEALRLSEEASARTWREGLTFQTEGGGFTVMPLAEVKVKSETEFGVGFQVPGLKWKAALEGKYDAVTDRIEIKPFVEASAGPVKGELGVKTITQGLGEALVEALVGPPYYNPVMPTVVYQCKVYCHYPSP